MAANGPRGIATARQRRIDRIIFFRQITTAHELPGAASFFSSHPYITCKVRKRR